MRKSTLVLTSLLALLGLGCPKPMPVPPPPPPSTDLDVGLNPQQSAAWRWTTEGSDLVPVDILRALIDVDTGKPFSESLDRFGFLPTAASAENPYGLPVGWTIDVPDYSLLKVDYVGLNCSACHTGELSYGGKSVRIDGAPNMADLEAFALAAEKSAIATFEDPVKAAAFVIRLLLLKPPANARPQASFAGEVPTETLAYLKGLDQNKSAGPEQEILGNAILNVSRMSAEELAAEEAAKSLSAPEFEGLSEEQRKHHFNILRFVRKYFRLIKSRAEFAVLALNAFKTSTVAGPGRDDPWNIIRNLLFLTPTELNSPVSIPHLFYTADFDWYHADANTNSVHQRDIAQAVALGAYVDPKTDESTLKSRNVRVLEEILDQIEAPAWPESFFGDAGKLDQEAVKRGAALFVRKMPGSGGMEYACADCHSSRKSQPADLSLIGTDPNRATSFLVPQDGKPFSEALKERVSRIEHFTNKKPGITPEEAAKYEKVYPPVWRETGKYFSRKLDGVWATAPYLHNGSVPTLYDLLLPVSSRPATFPLGNREYDPKKVGYRTDVSAPFTFDIQHNGNSNAGHEFGTTLSEQERWDLVEFLKTQ